MEAMVYMFVYSIFGLPTLDSVTAQCVNVLTLLILLMDSKGQ